MKKGLLKAAALGLVVVPAMGLLSACGGGSNKGKNTETTPAQLQERYVVLQGAMGKMATKGDYTSTDISGETTKTTTTTSVLTPGETPTWVDGEAEVEEEIQRTKEVSTLDATNGQYATNAYEWVVNEETKEGSWVKNDEESEYVVKTGTGENTKYVRYFNVPEYDIELGHSVSVKAAEYVSAGHAAHVYGLGSDMEMMEEMLGEDSYTKAIEGLKEMGAVFSLPLSMVLDSFGFDVEADFDTQVDSKFDIKKNGNKYSLEATLEFNLTEKAEEEEAGDEATALQVIPEMTLTFNTAYAKMTFAVDFTADGILGTNSNVETKVDVSVDTAVSKTHTVVESASTSEGDIEYTYDATQMPANFEGYPTTGIEKSQVEVEYYLDGKEQWSLEDSYEWGVDVTADVKVELPEATYAHTTIDGWYYDKECTRKVGENDTFNFQSWEKPKFYAKTVVDEGYAIVVEEYVQEYVSQWGTFYNTADWQLQPTVHVLNIAGGDTYTLPTSASVMALVEDAELDTEFTFDRIIDADEEDVTELTVEAGQVIVVRVVLNEVEEVGE